MAKWNAAPVCVHCLGFHSAGRANHGLWLRSGHIVSECALQPAVGAHSGFRMTSERVFLEVYAHLSGYRTMYRT